MKKTFCIFSIVASLYAVVMILYLYSSLFRPCPGDRIFDFNDISASHAFIQSDTSNHLIIDLQIADKNFLSCNRTFNFKNLAARSCIGSRHALLHDIIDINLKSNQKFNPGHGIYFSLDEITLVNQDTLLVHKTKFDLANQELFQLAILNEPSTNVEDLEIEIILVKRNLEKVIKLIKIDQWLVN